MKIQKSWIVNALLGKLDQAYKTQAPRGQRREMMALSLAHNVLYMHLKVSLNAGKGKP